MTFDPFTPRPRHRLFARVLLATFLLTEGGVLSCLGPGEASGPIADLEEDLEVATLDLAEALAEAQRAAPEGTILDAELEHEEHPLEYRFEIYEDGLERRVELRASDGLVTSNEVEELDPEEDTRLASLAATVDSAQVSAGEAIRIAERNLGGLAFDFRADEDRVFVIELLVNGRVHEAELDPISGAILDQHVDESW